MGRTVPKIGLAIAAAGVLLGAAGQSETFTVVEEGKKFDHREITMRVGDSVTFVNRDVYTHNVYSQTKGNEFDVGAQLPSQAYTIRFTTPGTVQVRCAIHPKMKLTVIVTP
jgi:plastocyanin